MEIKNRLKGHLQKRGDNTTGIQEAVAAKKPRTPLENVSRFADGFARGELTNSFFG